MRCNFSETQYAFGFVGEYVTRHRLYLAPFFPTIRAEGRGLGYDVRLQNNLFFQFKVPEFFNTENQGQRRLWNQYNHDYYRIKLNTDSNQHKFLKNLRARGRHNRIYYATPEFSTKREFSNHYMGRTIEDNSAIFPIDSLPAHGSGYHQLIYHGSERYGYCFSEPYKVEKAKYSDARSEQDSFINLYESAREIYNVLRESEIRLLGNFDFQAKFDATGLENKGEFIRQIGIALNTNMNVHWFASLY